MRIEYRRADPDDDGDVEALVRWANDDTIRHLTNFFADAEAEARRRTAEHVRQRLTEEQEVTYLVLVDGARAGLISFEVDAKQLHRKIPGTAWLGITIGEASLRGRGLGRQALAHLEKLAREAGCHRAELGVFEYNTAAHAFYLAAGYEPFAEIPELTYWNGRRWADLRLEKSL